jgi:hypothetical protein
MKLPAIVVELAGVYHEDVFDGNRVKYWLHEMKLHRSDLSARPSSSGPYLEDIDIRILQVLEAEPCCLVRTIAEFLKIPAPTTPLHLITSLNMKSRHSKWVPHFLDDDLRVKRLEGTRQFLDVLPIQRRCYFRDLITGDKTWVYLDMKPGTIRLPTDAELPIRVKRTITSEERMLIVFWGIHRITYCCWLPKDNILDLPFFCEKVLSPLAQKMQPNSKNSQTLDLDSCEQCKGSHGKGNPREIGCFPIQSDAAATV